MAARETRLFIVCGLLAAGCAREAPNVHNPDPALKVPAIEIAANQHDRSVVPQLIKDLESDDPAVRFYAIGGLRAITGENFGYRYYDDDREHIPAVKRWQDWLAHQPAQQR